VKFVTKGQFSDNPVQSVADIGYQVWLQRRAMGITQVQAAALCGVGVRFISDLENGKPTMETGRVLKVLARLGLSLSVRTDIKIV